MNIREVQNKYRDIEIDLLLAHVLKKPKEFLYLHPEYKLTNVQLNKLVVLIKRRQKGEPVAHILGHKYFYGLKFKVNKNVLIPRPETEWLVDRVFILLRHPESDIWRTKDLNNRFLGRTRNDAGKIDVLDIGTGSGCIPIAVAKNTKQKLNITAVDVSKQALIVARANAKTHKAKIKFIQSDLFKSVKGKFDIITANLPYVPLKRYWKLIKNLNYEPKGAITDGTDDFKIYHRFFAELPKYVNPGGVVLLEIDEDAKSTLSKYIKAQLPKTKFRFFKDLHGRDRYLEIEFK